MKDRSRFDFYMQEQKGCCYLMMTDACRMHAGKMREARTRYKKLPHDYATWDHIHTKPRLPSQAPVQLLACHACNQARGNAPASAAHRALAQKLLEEWRTLTGEAAAPGGKSIRRDMAKTRRDFIRHGPEGADHFAVMQAAMFEALEERRPVCSIGKHERKARSKMLAERRREKQNAPKGWSRDDEARLSARILAEREAEPSRAERNAESQAAAFRGIAGRAKANGDKATAFNMTQKAAAILEAVRGPKR